MKTHHSTCDIVILGGGLAGLTLALQLKLKDDGLKIQVLERRTHPVPEAAHKVGESSVEIGAHYFDKILGLGKHLKEDQLRKFGFRFFFSEGQRNIDQVTEIGASRHMSVPSYQIDRGIFENFLAIEAMERGIQFTDSSTVLDVELADDSKESSQLHTITFKNNKIDQTIKAKWVVDACGRAGIIKRKLNLTESNNHTAHAVWFRIKDRISIDDWSNNLEWRQRCNPQTRWLSTNHLVGTGYWVWLIPLASGSHSVGIVADPSVHPLDQMDTFEKAMVWLEKHQPLLFDDLDAKRGLLQDFAYFKRFSYGCKQVFSADRWALTGEAGLFLDPFYSPGSDFIAISNTYITELIALDRKGERLAASAQIFDQIYHSFYESTMALYQDQYSLFGDPEVLPSKVIWDYTYYWGILSQFFFHERLTDLSVMAALRKELADCQRLNLSIQAFFRQWSSYSEKRNPARMLDQTQLEWFTELNKSLTYSLNTPEFLERIRASHRLLHRLGRSILQQAQSDHPCLEDLTLTALLHEAGAHLEVNDESLLHAVTH